MKRKLSILILLLGCLLALWANASSTTPTALALPANQSLGQIAFHRVPTMEVNYFTGSWTDNLVTLEWETSTEQDILGFNVWRSETNLPITNGQIDTNQAVRLNDQIILNPNGACTSSGHLYSFSDDTMTPDQDVYYYYLEAYKCLSSTTEFYDGLGGGLEMIRPVSSTPTATPTSTQTEIVTINISPTEGGTLSSPNGQVQLDFPPGAVSTTTTVTYIEQTAPTQDTSSFLFAGTSFQVEATVTNFNQPFTMRVQYSDSDWLDAGIASEANLNLAYWNGNQWLNLLPCAGCSHDTGNNLFTIVLDHLTEFALLAEDETSIATHTPTPSPTRTATLTPAGSATATSTATPTPTSTSTALPTTATATSVSTSTEHWLYLPAILRDSPTSVALPSSGSIRTGLGPNWLYLPAILRGSQSSVAQPTPRATATVTQIPSTSTPTPIPTETTRPTQCRPVPRPVIGGGCLTPRPRPTLTPRPTQGPTRTPTPPAIINGDFEEETTGWVEYSQNGWLLIVHESLFEKEGVDVRPHSGEWAVWLGGDENEIGYIQQQVTVPSNRRYLTYWHWIASLEGSCSHDLAKVRINSSNVESYGLCLNTETGHWVQHSVNLSAYAGQSVTLQIRVETNGTRNSNLFLDDVSFQSSPAARENEPAPLDGTEETLIKRRAPRDGD